MPNFLKVIRSINRLMDTWPLRAANHAKNFFDKSWDNKGFTDKKLNKWEPVYKNGEEKESPLVDTGSLRKNIFAESDGKGEAIVYSSTHYAPYHNEGTEDLPQRQFMGESEQLEDELEEQLTKELDQIFDL